MLCKQGDPPPLVPLVKEKNRKLHGGVRTRLLRRTETEGGGTRKLEQDWERLRVCMAGQSSVMWKEGGR